MFGTLQEIGDALARAARPLRVYADSSTQFFGMQGPTTPAFDAAPLTNLDEISAVAARCINVISDDCSKVPLNLLDVTGDKPKILTNHPAVRLMRHINPVETPTLFFSQAYADLLTEGNSFTFIERDRSDGSPVSLLRLPPHEVEVDPHPTRIIKSYTWKKNTESETTYKAQDIWHTRTRHPNSIYRGLGHLVRLRKQAILDSAMRDWNIHRFQNGVPTSMIIKINRAFADDQSLADYAEKTWNEIKGLKNTGKPLFIKDGVTEITPVDRPNESELGYLASLKYTRNEFGMLFGVPPSRMSDFGEAFRANANEQATFYWLDTVMTWHSIMLDFLNSVFLPKNYADSRGEDGSIQLRFAYDYSQIRSLAKSEKDICDLWTKRVASGQATINEAREVQGLGRSPDPAADVLMINGKPIDSEVSASEPVENANSRGSVSDIRKKAKHAQL